MNPTLKEAIILAGKISAMQDTLAGLLNCKASDSAKVIATLMEKEGLTTATVTHAGRTFSATIRAAGKDSMTFDSDAAKALLTAAGIELPMRLRKGNAATAIIK